MGAKLNFKEAKIELDRMIEESRKNMNAAQAEAGAFEQGDPMPFFRGQYDALVELKYAIEGGAQPRSPNNACRK